MKKIIKRFLYIAFCFISSIFLLFLIGGLISLLDPIKNSGELPSRIYRKKAYQDMEKLSKVCQKFKTDVGYYPDKLSELFENKEKFPGWQGPYIENKEQLIDPWGNPYLIIFDSKLPYQFYLFSYGKNGYFSMDEVPYEVLLPPVYYEKPELKRKYMTLPPKHPPKNIFSEGK